MKNKEKYFAGLVVLAVTGISSYSNCFAQLEVEGELQATIDSIQQFSHVLSDSAVGIVNGQLEELGSRMKKWKLPQFKYSDPDLKDYFRKDYIPNPHGSDDGYIDDDGYKYFLRVVPPDTKMRLGKYVGKNFWMLNTGGDATDRSR